MTTDLDRLRLWGVSRLYDSHVLLLHFNRRPTDDELREVQEHIAERLAEHVESIGGQVSRPI